MRKEEDEGGIFFFQYIYDRMISGREANNLLTQWISCSALPDRHRATWIQSRHERRRVADVHMFTCSRVMLAVVVVVITQTGTGQDRTGQDDSLTLPALREV
jgi:hypothetical protein